MQLLKPFEELKIDEKVNIMHVLFPKQIKPFLSFTDLQIDRLTNDPSAFFESWSNSNTVFTASKWEELLREVKIFIRNKRDQLINDPALFSEAFTTGYLLTIFLQCLEEYIRVCQDDYFVNAVEFLFDF